MNRPQSPQLFDTSLLTNPDFLLKFQSLVNSVPVELDASTGPQDATKRSFHSVFGPQLEHFEPENSAPLQPTTVPTTTTTTAKTADTMNDGDEKQDGDDGSRDSDNDMTDCDENDEDGQKNDQNGQDSTSSESSSDDENDENNSDSDDESFPTGHSDPLSPQRMAEMDQLHQTMQSAFELSHQLTNEIDHIHSTISTLYSRAYPQLTKHLPRAKDYASALSILLQPAQNGFNDQIGHKMVKIEQNSDQNSTALTTKDTPYSPPQTLSHTQQQQISLHFGQQIAHLITMEFHGIQHGLLTDSDFKSILSGITRTHSLLKYSNQLTPVFAHCAKSLAPNLSALLSPSIAAQFIVHANGLNQLAAVSPQSLVSVGATKQAGQNKAALGGFGGAAASRMGIILEVPIIKSLSQSDEKKRQRGLRLVCRKTILAARADCQAISPLGDYGRQLKTEIEKNCPLFKKINPYKRVKALPVPGQRGYSRKASKKVRDKLRPSQLNKNSNMVRFGYDDSADAGAQQGELYDEFTGVSYGLVGNPAGGPVAVQQQKELVLSRLPAKIRHRLEHYKNINSLINNAYPYLFGLKQTQLVAQEDEVDLLGMGAQGG